MTEEIIVDCVNVKETVTLDPTSLVSFKHLNPKDDVFMKTYICRGSEKILLKDLWEEHKKFKLYKHTLEEIREMCKQHIEAKKIVMADEIINKIDEVLR